MRDRTEFIGRIAAAIQRGEARNGQNIPLAAATGAAEQIAEELPGLFRTDDIVIEDSTEGTTR